MLPYKNLIPLVDQSSPKYLQISNAIIKLIKLGQLAKSIRLPGSRDLAAQLRIHRKTVIAAYDELISQGWIEVIPSKGTYVSSELPVVQYQQFNDQSQEQAILKQTNYSFNTSPYLHRPDTTFHKDIISFNDGSPDTRIAPVVDIAKRYRSLIEKSYFNKYLGYGSIYGNDILRKELVKYLNETRGLKVEVENILITRGSQMALYLASQLLFKNEEVMIIGHHNYIAAELTFKYAGAKLMRVRIDNQGINTEEIEELCLKHSIKAVYITPHHHHPTTVTLSAKRRMHLLDLSYQYGFAIIEDDYDYDFHYNNAPILPLASSDHLGSVIYTGALCKIVVPGIRIGYMVAPKSIIEEAAHLRRIIDRQGDPMMELVFAHMIKDGDIQRHSKKALKIYKERRDLFCQLLQERLADDVSFEIPAGGMAIWTTLKNGGDWRIIYEKAKSKGLLIEPPEKYNLNQIDNVGIRIGFASVNESEIKKGIDILTSVIKAL